MNHDLCDLLDNYLADRLSADVALGVEAHLVHCETCREAVDQQRWIDGLLGSPFAAELETPSPRFVAHPHKRGDRRRRKSRIRASGLAVAAMIAVAAGWTIELNRQTRIVANTAPPGVALQGVENERFAAASEKEIKAADPPRSTFVGGPDVIVVPVESRHPNVTIVRVYSAYQPSYEAQASIDDPELGEFNGG